MILKYIAKRFFNGVVAVLLIVSIAFFVIRLIPGDPVDIWLGDYATPQLIEHVTQLWGLDRPIHQQYGIFLWQLFHGNLGTSLRAKAPVTGLIRDVFPYTLRLMLAGILISVVFGIMLGTFAAVRHNSARDIVTMIASMAFVSIPGFLMGYILLFLLGVKARAFPLIGGEDGWNLFSMWKHLTLPALSLGLAFAGTIARMTRSTMIEMLNTDFVRTARSKGLKESVVVYRHALRNTLTSIVSLIGVQIIVMLGGLVVTETVFSRPGLGRLYFTGVSARDYPLIQGCILVIALSVVVVTLVVDVSYGLIDPRIRYD